MTSTASQLASHPVRVVIVGGGFGGLYAARALGKSRAQVTLLDRNNHHLFQPLLYQVATASLSPAEIAAPIRQVLKRQKNTRVLLAEATGIDMARRVVTLRDGEIGYDYLVLAAGMTNSYFGRDEWAAHAPGLKDANDALEIREKFLLSFEAAEREADLSSRRSILTFVVIGGGPTGVELAGAMAEVARRALPREFRNIDTTTARIILLEGGPGILPTFPEKLRARAKRDLESMGVEVWVNARVTGIDERRVTIGEERIATRNVFWAAGVKASSLGASLGAEMDRSGRVIVKPDLSVPGRPEVFVVGDLASVADERMGGSVPGVAPAAMQMGRFVGRVIAGEIAGKSGEELARSADVPRADVPRADVFRYVDKGNLATIGRARAVGVIKGQSFAGFAAWALWMGIHIFFLIGFRSRVIVMVQWAWAYFRWERGARLVTRPSGERLAELRAAAPVASRS
ncbi:MAG: NAD(P)/FAD-dependent oxidoreductase [Phycisphaerales bacterium]